jgi:hypothetical protein
MKKLSQLALGCLLLTVGFACGRYKAPVVHAQSTYLQQYVLEVNTQRGFNGVRFMKNNGTQINLDDGTWGTEAAASPVNGTTFTKTEPVPNSTATFTETYSQP